MLIISVKVVQASSVNEEAEFVVVCQVEARSQIDVMMQMAMGFWLRDQAQMQTNERQQFDTTRAPSRSE